MVKRYLGGVLSPTTPTVTALSASGMYTVTNAAQYTAAGTWPQPADIYFEYVTMLLPGNGTNGAQNNTFLDNSTNNFTITRNGNTTQGTFTPYGSNWSVAFDGSQTSPPLSFPSISAYDLGSTSQWTIECWVYFNSLSNEQSIFERWNGTGGPGWLLTKLSSNAYRVHFGSSVFIDTSAIAVAGQWIHLAVSRDGSSGSIFVNGVRQATTSSVANFSDGTDPLVFGERNSGSQTFPLNGYISNARIVKGSYVYNPASTSVTVPTSPLTAITNTVFLGLQSNRPIDISINQASGTLTSNGSVQRFSPFNPTTPYAAGTIGGSGYFDGSGDYLNLSSNAAFALPSSFTFECWVYRTGTGASQCVYLTNANDGLIIYTVSNKVVVRNFNGSDLITSSSDLQYYQWTHIAVSRSGTTLSLWLNGSRTAGGTTTNSTSFAQGAVIVGTNESNTIPLGGYVCDLRLVKGTAVYDPTQTTITVPTAPLTAVTNTSLLLNFTNAGIIDNAMMNDLETVGNAQISTAQSKFGGGSLAFDGSGDYLICNTTPSNYVFGTGDFTMEMWIYAPTVSPSYQGIWDSRTADPSVTPHITLVSGAPTWWVSGAARITGSTLVINTWYHLAVVRSSGVTKMYLNGTQTGSNYTDSNNYTSRTSPTIGINFDIIYPFTGYLDDFRVTKGYARYTANFTPPTSPFQLQ